MVNINKKIKYLLNLGILNVLTLNILYAGSCKKNKNKEKEGCCKKKTNIKNDISDDNNEDLDKKTDDGEKPNPSRKPGDDGNGGSEETEEEKAKKLLEKQKQDNLKKQLNDYKTKIQSVLDDIPPLLNNLESKYNSDKLKTGENLSKVNVTDYNITKIKTKLDEVANMFKDGDLYTDANTGFKTELDSLNKRYNTLDTNINALGKKVDDIKLELAKNKDKNDLISEITNLINEINVLLNNDEDNSLIGIINTETKSTEKNLKITKYIGIFKDIKIKLNALKDKVNSLESGEKTNYDTKVNDLKAKIIKSENSILDLFKKKFDELKSNNPTKEIEDFINTNFTEANLKSDKIKTTSKNIENFKNEHNFSNLGEFKTLIESIVTNDDKDKLYNRKISEIIKYDDIEKLFKEFSNKNNQIDKIKDFCERISDIYDKKEDKFFYTHISCNLKNIDEKIGNDTDIKIIDILKKVINSIIDNEFISKLDSIKLDDLDFSICNDDDSIINYFNVIKDAESTLYNVNITEYDYYKNLKHLQYDEYNKKIKKFKDKLIEKSEDENYKTKKSEFNTFLKIYDNTCSYGYNNEITYPDFNKDELDFNKLKVKLNSIKVEDVENSFNNIKELKEHFNNYSKLLNDTKNAIEGKIESCKELLKMLNEGKNSIYFKYKKIETTAKITEITDEKNKLDKFKSSLDTKINEYNEFFKTDNKLKKLENYYNRELNLQITFTKESFDGEYNKFCNLTLKTYNFDGEVITYNSTDINPAELKHEKYDYRDSFDKEIKNCSKFRISENLYKEIKRKSCTKKLLVNSNINTILPPNTKLAYNYYLFMEIKNSDHYIYFVPLSTSWKSDLCHSTDFMYFFCSNIILSGYKPSSFYIDGNKKPDVVKIHSLSTENLGNLGEKIKFFDLRGLYFQNVGDQFRFPANSTIVFDLNSIGDGVKFKTEHLNSLYHEGDKVTVYIVKRYNTDDTNNTDDKMYLDLLKKFPKDNKGRITVNFIDDDDPIFKI